ncbi:MAG TPA: helix-turn-helix domain-containing protein [Blastocatellia bacterium]|nr:helix-turn-helix domain-containing protein [Blastocatellia bacterium]
MKAELESLIDQMISRGILYDEAVREFEKRFIQNVLERHNHNLSKAAIALGIHRNTLSKRLEEYEKGSAARSNGYVRKQVAPRRKRLS